MENITVKPFNEKKERLWVFLSILLIILTSYILIESQKESSSEKQLKKYQVGSWELNKKENRVFLDLFTAGSDIDLYHMGGERPWPKVAVLEEGLIAPFLHDETWEYSGRLQWQLVYSNFTESVHQGGYCGISQEPEKVGNFILLLEHYHALDGANFYSVNKNTPFQIWFKKGSIDSTTKNFSEGYLIKNGWREVIPHLGKKELKKLDRS